MLVSRCRSIRSTTARLLLAALFLIVRAGPLCAATLTVGPSAVATVDCHGVPLKEAPAKVHQEGLQCALSCAALEEQLLGIGEAPAWRSLAMPPTSAPGLPHCDQVPAPPPPRTA
jgi:hypothetical protein